MGLAALARSKFHSDSQELDLDRDLVELELGLDRDLGLPLSGAPGGDDGVLDPMSLPGAADDLDGLLDGDLDGVRRVRFEFEFEFEYGDVDDRPYNARLRFLCRCSRYLRLLRSSATLNSFPILVNSRSYLRRVLASTIFPYFTTRKKMYCINRAMIAAVFVLIIIMGAGMLAYLYWWQQQQQTKVVPPPKRSIADLHGECIENPLNCQVDEVTTIEEGDDPEYYEKEYGFKTNLQKMKQDLKSDGTCEDDECPEIKALEAKTRKITQDALRDSMNHCKLRLPGDRLKRKTYDPRGKLIGREPTTNVGVRNIHINDFAEPLLDEMIANDTTAYQEYETFLDAYGPKLGKGDYLVGGITDCDFYVKGCAVKESDVCHPDAIKKHKDILKNRPPIIDIPEEEYEKELKESGLIRGPDGTIMLSVVNQKTMTGLSDEEKAEMKRRYDESAAAARRIADRTPR